MHALAEISARDRDGAHGDEPDIHVTVDVDEEVVGHEMCML